MKKELIALLLLIALFAGSLINISFNEQVINELSDGVFIAYTEYHDGDTAEAAKTLEAVCDKWLSLDGYTHIFIRHSEIDSTTDAFFELLSAMHDEKPNCVCGAYSKLKAHLDSLTDMEKLSLGSIF